MPSWPLLLRLQDHIIRVCGISGLLWPAWPSGTRMAVRQRSAACIPAATKPCCCKLPCARPQRSPARTPSNMLQRSDPARRFGSLLRQGTNSCQPLRSRVLQWCCLWSQHRLLHMYYFCVWWSLAVVAGLLNSGAGRRPPAWEVSSRIGGQGHPCCSCAYPQH